MAAVAERGIKRVCLNCSTKFFDFSKSPIICPNCGTEFTGYVKAKGKRGRPAAEKPVKEAKKKTPADLDDEDENLDDDVISLDDVEEDDEDDIDEDLKGDIDLDEFDDIDSVDNDDIDDDDDIDVKVSKDSD